MPTRLIHSSQAPEVVRGEHYSTSADVYSFAMTILCFAIRGDRKLSEYLNESYCNARLSKDSTARNATKISDNKIAHSMVNKSWRPPSFSTDLNVPSTVANLIEICWLVSSASPEATTREDEVHF